MDERIAYDKRSGPVTADEVCALAFLADRGQLPPNPIAELDLQRAVQGLGLGDSAELGQVLAGCPDEGAGIRELLAASLVAAQRLPFEVTSRRWEVVCPDDAVRTVTFGDVTAALEHAQLLTDEAPPGHCVVGSCRGGAHRVRPVKVEG